MCLDCSVSYLPGSYQWGCRHEAASGGEEAFRLLRQASAAGEPFDLALLDMMMPGMEGEQLGRAIKADPEIKETRLVTHHILAEDKLQAQARRSKACILLAEDNIVNQKVAKRVLEKLGYHVDAVANGMEAVKVLGAIPYDIVLMDCQMPEMDGYEATGHIRGMEQDEHTPIIAMTAGAMQGDRERCLEAGMDDYVTKPFIPKTLAEVIDKWLNTSAADQPNETAQQKDAPEEKVFDKADLLSRLMGDEALARELIEAFLDDTPHQLTELRKALENGDAPLARRQAHTIKGASANIGAIALREVAGSMEATAEADNMADTVSQMPRLARQFEVLKETLAR